MLHTTTNSGLHDFVGERVLARYARPGVRAADLGAGPGAMAGRLQSFGCEVAAVDRDANGFEAQLPHISLDFDQPDFASPSGPASFGLVTAIEVIEHVESPISFLRNGGRLLGEHLVFPSNGYQLTRKPLAWILRLAALAFSGAALLGDNHIFVLEDAL